MLRAKVIQSIRARMVAQDFTEFQTPILTASSPKAPATSSCRHACIPASSMRCRSAAAVPAAGDGFGFDPISRSLPASVTRTCRADRSPGEFYQLDLEMSFVEQQDVFDAVEPVIRSVFEFSDKAVDRNSVLSPSPSRC